MKKSGINKEQKTLDASSKVFLKCTQIRKFAIKIVVVC